MIQRVQSVYLLLIVVLITILPFIPFAEFLINNHVFEFYLNGIKEAGNNQDIFVNSYPLLAIYILVDLIAFVTIFLFSNRMLQMRLSRLNMMLIIGSFALFAYYIYKLVANEQASWTFSFALIIPLIVLVLYYLVIKNIKKDDVLIKSIDRIR